MKRESGLSLLELLISLVLLGLISAMSYQSLSTTFRAWQVSAFAASESDEYAGQRFLRQQLGRALPVYRREKSSRTRLITFEGGESEMTFLSPLQDFGGVDRALYRCKFKIEGDEHSDAQSLIFQYRTYTQKDLAEAPEFVSVPVVIGITAAKFEYLGGRSKRWREDYTDQKTLPEAVRFSFLDRNNQNRIWTIPLTLSEPKLLTYSGPLDDR